MKLVGSREAVRSPEFHKKKVTQKKIRLTVLVIFVLLILATQVFLIRNKNLLISDVEIMGNQVTRDEDIQKITVDNLSGSYLWVFPKLSVVLYPANKIERDLLNLIPRLATANASLTSAKSIKVTVTERLPFALYCSDTSDSENPSHCFFLDESGFIFSPSPAFSGGVYMIYSSDPAIETPLRSQFLTREEFQDLSKFLALLPRMHIAPELFTKRGDEYELTLVSGPYIKWKTGQNLDNLAINLESFLLNSSLKPEDISQLKYIDLRFDNKVFYKFQGE